MHARYIAFTLRMLAEVPYLILHGVNRNGNCMNFLFHDNHQVYDINADSIAHAMYNGGRFAAERESRLRKDKV